MLVTGGSFEFRGRLTGPEPHARTAASVRWLIRRPLPRRRAFVASVTLRSLAGVHPAVTGSPALSAAGRRSRALTPPSVQPPRHDVRAPCGDQPEPHRGDEKKSDQVQATRQRGEDATVHPQSREADVTTQAGHHRTENDRQKAAHRPHGVHAGRRGEPIDGGRNHDEDGERGQTRRSEPCRQASVSCAGVRRNSSSTHCASVTPPEERRQTLARPLRVHNAARVNASQRHLSALMLRSRPGLRSSSPRPRAGVLEPIARSGAPTGSFACCKAECLTLALPVPSLDPRTCPPTPAPCAGHTCCWLAATNVPVAS